MLVILKAVHGRLRVGEFDTKSAKAVFKKQHCSSGGYVAFRYFLESTQDVGRKLRGKNLCNQIPKKWSIPQIVCDYEKRATQV